MKNNLITLLLLTALLAACEFEFTLEVPDIEIDGIEIAGCDVLPELCNRSDEEFEEFFDALTDEEQSDYVDAQFVPEGQTGFVSLSTIATVYGTYEQIPAHLVYLSRIR